mmetsp:Transcript_110583/g.312849  ORF Transcript_110583/g.312849 Transcript_110583/m.312849 type:complete len:280 (+) Transcript_110583:502-1341(+)
MEGQQLWRAALPDARIVCLQEDSNAPGFRRGRGPRRGRHLVPARDRVLRGGRGAVAQGGGGLQGPARRVLDEAAGSLEVGRLRGARDLRRLHGHTPRALREGAGPGAGQGRQPRGRPHPRPAHAAQPQPVVARGHRGRVGGAGAGSGPPAGRGLRLGDAQPRIHGPPRDQIPHRPLPPAVPRPGAPRLHARVRQHVEARRPVVPVACHLPAARGRGVELVDERVRALELRGLDARARPHRGLGEHGGAGEALREFGVLEHLTPGGRAVWHRSERWQLLR